MINRSFYFLRHGQTNENLRKILQGHTDTDLNEQGRLQAEDAAHILKQYPIDRIIASPLKRATETAEIVNRILQKPLSFDESLKERNYGIFETKSFDTINQWFLENPEHNIKHPYTRYAAPLQGEIYEDFERRVKQIFINSLNQYNNDNILFVSHGGVFKTLHLHLTGAIVETKNAHPYHFDYTSDAWLLKCLVTDQTEGQAA